MRATPTAAVEAVGVGRGLSVAEVAAVATSPDTAGHSALLYCLADHHAVLLELFRENSVEKWVAAGVKWQDKYGENLEW